MISPTTKLPGPSSFKLKWNKSNQQWENGLSCDDGETCSSKQSFERRPGSAGIWELKKGFVEKGLSWKKDEQQDNPDHALILVLTEDEKDPKKCKVSSKKVDRVASELWAHSASLGRNYPEEI